METKMATLCKDCYWYAHEHPLATDDLTYDCIDRPEPSFDPKDFLGTPAISKVCFKPNA